MQSMLGLIIFHLPENRENRKIVFCPQVIQLVFGPFTKVSQPTFAASFHIIASHPISSQSELFSPSKMSYPALAGWLTWLEHCTCTERLQVQFLIRTHTQVVGLIPSQGVCGRQPIDVSFSHQCFSFSLSVSPSSSFSKINKRILGQD